MNPNDPGNAAGELPPQTHGSTARLHATTPSEVSLIALKRR